MAENSPPTKTTINDSCDGHCFKGGRSTQSNTWNFNNNQILYKSLQGRPWYDQSQKLQMYTIKPECAHGFPLIVNVVLFQVQMKCPPPLV